MRTEKKLFLATILAVVVAAVMSVCVFAAYDLDLDLPKGAVKGDDKWVDSGYSDIDAADSGYTMIGGEADHSATDTSWPTIATLNFGRFYWNKNTDKAVFVVTGNDIGAGLNEWNPVSSDSQSQAKYGFAAHFVDVTMGNTTLPNADAYKALADEKLPLDAEVGVNARRASEYGYKIFPRYIESGKAIQMWTYFYVTKASYVAYMAKWAELEAAGLKDTALEDALVEYVYNEFAGYRMSTNIKEAGANVNLTWVFNQLATSGYIFDTVEFRTKQESVVFSTYGYALRRVNAKTILFDSKINSLGFTKRWQGLFYGITALKTFDHVSFAEDGSHEAVVENVVDLRGFDTTKVHETNYFLSHLLSGSKGIKEVIWFDSIVSNENEKAGHIDLSAFSGIESLVRVTIPEGVVVKAFADSAFKGCDVLRCITIKGSVAPDITIGTDVFAEVKSGCIIQCATQADIDNLNKALSASGITTVKAVSMDTPFEEIYVTALPAAPAWKAFDPKGATAYGELSDKYTKNFWAYYAETKTLEIISNQPELYNEVGTLANATDGYGWTDYITEIEHVIIGPGIQKLTASFAEGMVNLKDVRITSSISEASGAFKGCVNLTTIWIDGMERVEGRVMLAGANKNFKLDFLDTSIKSIHMGSSPVALVGNIKFNAKVSEICYDFVTDEMIEFGKTHFINISNGKGEVIGNFYVEVPEGLPGCGDSSVFDFDRETGTLTVLGKGPIQDIGNYWGGGSKTQYWFSVKNEIKHVVITEHITSIGMYAFTECKNLETVELPAKSDFRIMNAAFEKCPNLRAIYIKGNEPIVGTYDLSLLEKIETFTFSGNYRVVNVILNEKVDKIGVSVFEECSNLTGIYGVPGSYAEEYAKKNGLTFYDKATNTPEPLLAEIPTVPETTDTVAPETTDTVAPDTTTPVEPDTAPVGGDDQQTDGGSNILPVIIIIAAVVVVAIVVVVVIIAKKKKGSKAE